MTRLETSIAAYVAVYGPISDGIAAALEAAARWDAEHAGEISDEAVEAACLARQNADSARFSGGRNRMLRWEEIPECDYKVAARAAMRLAILAALPRITPQPDARPTAVMKITDRMMDAGRDALMHHRDCGKFSGCENRQYQGCDCASDADAVLQAAASVAPTPQPDARVQKEVAEAHAYLAGVLKTVAPQCQPLPDLLGLCTQIDNYIAGTRSDAQWLHKEFVHISQLVVSAENALTSLKTGHNSAEATRWLVDALAPFRAPPATDAETAVPADAGWQPDARVQRLVEAAEGYLKYSVQNVAERIGDDRHTPLIEALAPFCAPAAAEADPGKPSFVDTLDSIETPVETEPQMLVPGKLVKRPVAEGFGAISAWHASLLARGDRVGADGLAAIAQKFGEK